jgi:YfiH family protein
MNLGAYVGDDPSAVAANVQLLERSTAARSVFNRQVHGTGVHVLRAGSAQQQSFDASVTTERGLMCTATVADCCPVLFCALDAHGRALAVGAAHAGWRGLAGGVLNVIYEEIKALPSEYINSVAIKNVASKTNEVLCWVGPCIGQAAFEVGPEVREAFLALHAEDAAHFQAGRTDRWHADLAGLVRAALQRLDKARVFGNDSSNAWCTVANPGRFFSHRREGGRTGADEQQRSTGTGRMVAAVWMS